MRSLRFCVLAASMMLVGAIPFSASADPVASMTGTARNLVKPPPGFVDACLRYDWLCGEPSGTDSRLGDDALLDLARSINRRVNFLISPLSDAENLGVADRWSLPVRGNGDCEDYALLKYKLLLEAGVDARDLSIAVVRNGRRENHAVLVLRHASGDLVLDSETSSIVPWNETRYRFLAMQTSDDRTAWEIVAGRPKTSALLARR